MEIDYKRLAQELAPLLVQHAPAIVAPAPSTPRVHYAIQPGLFSAPEAKWWDTYIRAKARASGTVKESGNGEKGTVDLAVRDSKTGLVSPYSLDGKSPLEISREQGALFRLVGLAHICAGSGSWSDLGIHLHSGNSSEGIQMTLYNKGEFYKQHKDEAFKTESGRKVSISVTMHNATKGGRMAFANDFVQPEHLDIIHRPGSAIVFTSWLPHEITPVEIGWRTSLVMWLHGTANDPPA